ncbi:hypothetical protein BJX66DRAFT_313173 [Aspergillus keveii]|uniref:Secreted protein n=1 Tax=Aspergillus keveii TaxID=714993 RepID=A0ABR4FSK3_9EURO
MLDTLDTAPVYIMTSALCCMLWAAGPRALYLRCKVLNHYCGLDESSTVYDMNLKCLRGKLARKKMHRSKENRKSQCRLDNIYPNASQDRPNTRYPNCPYNQSSL